MAVPVVVLAMPVMDTLTAIIILIIPVVALLSHLADKALIMAAAPVTSVRVVQVITGDIPVAVAVATTAVAAVIIPAAVAAAPGPALLLLPILLILKALNLVTVCLL